jgi:uncharacterized protein (UPF0335 family)
MAEIVGKNTPSAEVLRSFIDRVEHIDEQKKALAADRAAVLAEAKSAGFDTKAMARLLKRRKAKPHDLQEADTIDDLYRHAVGMDSEPPLFRQIGALAREAAGGEKLLDAFKLLVPPSGEIIVTIGGKRMRLWRDKDGEPRSEDYTPPEPAKSSQNRAAPSRPPRDVPACTPDEAEALGEQAAKDNVPVIDNPFPYGDERRPRWDAGWRNGNGNDGFGGV